MILEIPSYCTKILQIQASFRHGKASRHLANL